MLTILCISQIHCHVLLIKLFGINKQILFKIFIREGIRYARGECFLMMEFKIVDESCRTENPMQTTE